MSELLKDTWGGAVAVGWLESEDLVAAWQAACVYGTATGGPMEGSVVYNSHTAHRRETTYIARFADGVCWMIHGRGDGRVAVFRSSGTRVFGAHEVADIFHLTARAVRMAISGGYLGSRLAGGRQVYVPEREICYWGRRMRGRPKKSSMTLDEQADCGLAGAGLRADGSPLDVEEAMGPLSYQARNRRLRAIFKNVAKKPIPPGMSIDQLIDKSYVDKEAMRTRINNRGDAEITPRSILEPKVHGSKPLIAVRKRMKDAVKDNRRKDAPLKDHAEAVAEQQAKDAAWGEALIARDENGQPVLGALGIGDALSMPAGTVELDPIDTSEISLRDKLPTIEEELKEILRSSREAWGRPEAT